jgi:hypothetical protein
MAKQPQPDIAELQPGPEPRGGGRTPLPHRGPGIAELQVGPPWVSPPQEAVTELFRLRDRVHALESQSLAARMYYKNPLLAEYPVVTQPWRLAEYPPVTAPFEAFYRSFSGGELSGPVYTTDQLIGLLEALIAALKGNVPPPGNPAEFPR